MGRGKGAGQRAKKKNHLGKKSNKGRFSATSSPIQVQSQGFLMRTKPL
jgi:hypothetical protein